MKCVEQLLCRTQVQHVHLYKDVCVVHESSKLHPGGGDDGPGTVECIIK